MISRRYGALELKQNYQHGLLLGLLAAALLHVGALWALSVYGGLQDLEPLNPIVRRLPGEGELKISQPFALPPEAIPPGELPNERVRESSLPETQMARDQGVLALRPDSLFAKFDFTPKTDPTTRRTGDLTTPGDSKTGRGSYIGPEVGMVPDLPKFGEFVYTTRPPEPLPNQPQPRYSELARDMEAEGMVRLSLLVSASGDVLDIVLIDPNGETQEVLVELASVAVRKWKFKPALQYDRAVAVWYLQSFNFDLR